jgi:hypothetical protein
MWLKVSRIWLVLVAIFIFAADVSTGGDFYYGGFHAQSVLEKCPALKDSLKFNLVFLIDLDSSNIHYLRDDSLKGVAEQGDQNSPTWWSGHSFYTLWEAEGFPGSRKGFTYQGGTQVCDPQAHPYPCSGIGWNAIRFCNPSDSGIVQAGPDYWQYGLGDDPYLVDFNLKFSGDRSIPAKQVCKIMVDANGSIIRDSTLVVQDFPLTGYKEFKLDYKLSDLRSTQFKIQWFGVESLYVDYVTVYNAQGLSLMRGEQDTVLKNYVQQSWVDTSVVYRWYMKDQPGSIDCYMPYAHIDTLLKSNYPYKPGAQFTCYFGDTNSIQEYLVRTDPIEYMVDAYPFGADDTIESNIQQSLNWLTDNYNYNKRKAEGLNKDFWVATQAHAVGYRKTTPSCDSGLMQYEYPPGSNTYYCLFLKDPTANEVRVQTFLAMCYGADAVMNYRASYYLDTINFQPPYFETGLYDQYRNMPTLKWAEIIDFTGPRVEKIGHIIKDMIWQGAGVCYNVTSIPGSFINTVKSTEFDSAWIETGFFKDGSNADYFMLVNRRCLSIEAQNVTVYIDSAGMSEHKKMWYVIDQYSHDTTFTGAINGSIPFTTHLDPGEGKLFKLACEKRMPNFDGLHS